MRISESEVAGLPDSPMMVVHLGRLQRPEDYARQQATNKVVWETQP